MHVAKLFLLLPLLFSAPFEVRPQEPAVQAAPAKVEGEALTPERVQAAWSEVLECSKELGLEREQAPPLELATRTQIRRVLADELLPQLLPLHAGDEAAARVQARQSAATYSRMLLAKYSWTQKKVLVCAESWTNVAEALERPELMGDLALRAVLLHELVHAADARALAFHELLARCANEEELRALDAVIEGNAQRVARALCARKGWGAGFDVFTKSIGAPAAAANEDPASALFGRVLGAQLSTSYVEGERFMSELHAAKGAEGIVAAFTRPPRDMGEIFHLEWYLDPKTRPLSNHALDAGLDVLENAPRETKWLSKRLNIMPSVLLASMGDMPREDMERVLRSMRQTRILVLQPESQPSTRMMTLAFMSMHSPEDGLAMLAMEEGVTRRKDELLTSGSVQITHAEYAAIEGRPVRGFTCMKKMQVQTSEQELRMVVCARDGLVAELTYIVEPGELANMVELTERALDAALGRGAKQD